MKRILSLSALGIAALCTSLWAQQADEPEPTQAPAASADSRYRVSADGAATPAAGSTGAESALPSTGQQPARASTRTPAPNSRPGGSGRSSFGGEGGAPGGSGQMPGQPFPGYAQPYGIPQAYFPTPSTYNYGYANYGQPGLEGYPPTQEDMQSAREFRETVDALRKAKTDEEKVEVREKLNALVAKQLDQDLADREKRLIEIEAKAKELREQLQQRKQTKTEIQKMLVMLIENPQGGLGLPPSWMNAINQPMPSYPQPTVAPATVRRQ